MKWAWAACGSDSGWHRHTGYFLLGGRGAANHLPKKFSQVAQIFTKKVQKKRGPYDATINIGRTYKVKVFLHMNSTNRSYEELMNQVTRNKAVVAILTAKYIIDTILVIVDHRVGICPFIVSAMLLTCCCPMVLHRITIYPSLTTRNSSLARQPLSRVNFPRQVQVKIENIYLFKIIKKHGNVFKLALPKFSLAA